jgi:methionyl-tRNA synthetase
LFPRIDVNAEPEEEKASLDLKPEISFDEFQRLDIRMGKIIQAEKHPNADKLLKLQVDLGAETRQIIAGIAEHFEPTALVGQTIAILANLKPARIRGEISQGMLLAAEDDSMVAPLKGIADIKAGAKVR